MRGTSIENCPQSIYFHLLMNADGKLNKYKAPLVAQGNFQDESTFFVHEWRIILDGTLKDMGFLQLQFDKCDTK